MQRAPDEVPGKAAVIRVLLADDHTVMRAGTRRILEDAADLRVVGEAENGRQTIELQEILRADVVLLDIAMPLMDGIRVSRVLRERWPETHILVLTGHENEGFMRALHRLGVTGYLLKSAGPDELIAGIRAVAAGNQVFSRRVTQVLQAPVADERMDAVSAPTERERVLMYAVARGLRNRQIADELHLSINTVEYHLRHIFTKLRVATRAEAIAQARRCGWLDIEEPLC